MRINDIHYAESSEFLANKITPGSIDICITSPPYKDSDGYSEKLMCNVFRGVYQDLKPNSLFFLNFGHLAEDKFRPFRVCQLALEAGFQLNDTIIWVKNHYRPIQGSKKLNNLSEFIFMLFKGKMPNIDRLAIGVPYKDKSNVKRFAGGQDLKCGGNIWYIPYDTIQDKSEKLHNDRFPLELPTRCLKLSGLKSGVCLDPFSGSGTTCLAAKQQGLSYIGVEKDFANAVASIFRIEG